MKTKVSLIVLTITLLTGVLVQAQPMRHQVVPHKIQEKQKIQADLKAQAAARIPSPAPAPSTQSDVAAQAAMSGYSPRNVIHLQGTRRTPFTTSRQHGPISTSGVRRTNTKGLKRF